MRGIYQDKISRTFIEGPIQTEQVGNSFQEPIEEKAVYQAYPSIGYGLEGGNSGSDSLENESNERLDHIR
jgi:hypothetical protein